MIVTDSTAFECYKLYNALKLHFTSNYDFVKYNGKTQVSEQSFSSRKDKYHFYKISRKYNKEDIFGFFLSNLVHNPNCWAGDLIQDESTDIFRKWQRRTQSLFYIFEQDIDKLFDGVDNPENLLVVRDGQYPTLFSKLQRNEVCIETVIVMNDLMNFLPAWSKKVQDDIIFPTFVKKCQKYSPFVNYEKNKFKNSLLEKLNDHAEA